MARLYSNENLPIRIVLALRELGHDVVTSFEAGNANAAIPDDAVLRFATDNHRAVVTLNRRDFQMLHRLTAEHSGIIVCTDDSDRTALAGRIHAAIETLADLRGQLIKIHRPNRHQT